MEEGKGAKDKLSNELSKNVTWIEPKACACLNFGCLLVILGILATIAVILDVFTISGLSRITNYFWNSKEDAITEIKS